MSSKQIAIVTGASSGIGRHIARGLPARYSLDELWVIARSGDKLRALREELSIPVRALPFDLTKEESISALRTLLKEEQPEIKVLVNASGYGKFERFDRIAEADAAGMVELNCRALTLVMQAALPYCQKGSIVVNIASVAAFQPVPFGAEYAATKAYVLALSRAVNKELRPRGINVLAARDGQKFRVHRAGTGGEHGKSRTFDALPHQNPAKMARKALSAGLRGRSVCTMGAFYKFYRFLAHVLPKSVLMKFTRC